MGKVEISFCCSCGTSKGSMTKYWQWTDMSSRSTEAIKENDKVDLCSTCLEQAKKDFKGIKKFNSPRKEQK